jgi:S1-C subfamily serine protease
VVRSVLEKSPAETAGIAAGDHVLAVAGRDVSRLDSLQLGQLIRAEGPPELAIRLSRGGRAYTARVKRERLSAALARSGQKIVAGGAVFPADASEAEIARAAAFDGRRVQANVFPTHYPPDAASYYAGFELFVLRDPPEVMIGGVEDGPASRAGARWGDRIVSVDGVDPVGKTPAELERLFSGPRPRRMRLTLDRVGKLRTLQLDLERAADTLARNGLRLEKGKPVPAAFSPEDVRCLFERR